ncbi:hypothetical protein D3C86_1513430 [compost metagenome]
MVVCTAGYQVITFLQECLRHCLCIFDHLLCVYFIFILQDFVEGNRFSCNYVFQRTALDAREYRQVKQIAHHLDLAFRRFMAPWVFKIMLHHNDTTTRSAQGLVRSRGYKMTMIERRIQ